MFAGYVSALLAIAAAARSDSTRANDPDPERPIVLAIDDPILAADSPGWRWSFAPYLWMTHLDGTIEAEGVEGDIDSSFGDIWDHFDVGAMGHLEFGGDRWGLMTDVTYAQLSAEDESQGTETELGSDLLIAELGAYLRVTSLILSYADGPGERECRMSIDFIGGARYIDTDTSVDLSGVTTASGDHSESWMDGFIGARVYSDWGQDFAFSLRADAGGFGIGGSTDMAFNVTALIGYRLGENTTLFAGFRVFDVDFEEDDFVYDVRTAGPVIGVDFR